MIFGRFPLLCAALAVSATSLCAADVPRWISVMPLHNGLAETLACDAAQQGETTFIDGIAWRCSVHPEGDPPADKAAIFASLYRETAAALRTCSSVRQGILLQATMGHGGLPGSPTPWQLTVKPDGTSVYRMCPLDERFLEYIARTCRTFSAAKPDFFMVDDDTRLVFDDMAPGCFCPLHLSAFAKRTGKEWTRDEVVALLSKGESREAAVWDDVKAESLRRFFITIRENFASDIPGMLCVVGSSAHLRHAREFAEILAAPGQIPVVRGAGAPYHDGGKELFHVVAMRSQYAAQRQLIGVGALYLQESDTCPHTLWATSAMRTLDHLVMLALDGCKGAKIWITRTGNYHEKKSAAAYRRLFRENKGLVEWVSKTDIRPCGVVIPVDGPPGLNFADRYLSLCGIPYRFGTARAGEVTALTADTLSRLEARCIHEILSGAVILDGSAALWLAANGYAGDIGVDAKEWKRKTIQLHVFEDGTRQAGMRTKGLADLTAVQDGAEILTKLLNRPRMGAEAVYEAPGSVFFKNGRGGSVLTLAQPLPVQMPEYNDATLFSESYKAQMVRWISRLCGKMPAYYAGVGPVMCLSGETTAGERILVLDALDIDGDDAPEVAFMHFPETVERLGGDGKWRSVPFAKTEDGACRLDSRISPQQPAIFRW